MRAIISFAAISLFAINVHAVPMLLSQQGRLLDASDQPLAGSAYVTFALWDSDTAVSPIWTEVLDVSFDNGYYSVQLGTSVPLNRATLDNSELYLSLAIAGEELLPRHRVVSAPYAIVAGTAENLIGGAVDASSISVGGVAVVDDTGAWVGPSVPDTLTGLSCSEGDVAAYTGSGWDCVAGSSFDTDTQLSEAQVEGYVTNGPLDLAASTTLNTEAISTEGHVHDNLETRVSAIEALNPFPTRYGIAAYAGNRVVDQTAQADMSFNSTGGSVSISGTGGSYQVTFGGIDCDVSVGTSGIALATGGQYFCRTTNWSTVAGNCVINVACFDFAGNLVGSPLRVVYLY